MLTYNSPNFINGNFFCFNKYDIIVRGEYEATIL